VSNDRPSRSLLRRLWRHTWRGASGIIAAGVIVLAALSFDEDLLDTRELRLEPRQLSEAENAWPILAQAAESLGTIHDAEAARWSALVRGDDWDDEEADAILDGHANAVTAIRGLRDFTFAQAPVARDAGSAYALHPKFHLPSLLALVEARRLQRQGEPLAATRLLQDCLHATRLMEEARGDLLFFHYAQWMRSDVLAAAAALVSEPRVSSEDCRTLLREFSRSRPSRDGFFQTFAAAYQSEALIVDALRHPEKMPADWQVKSTTYLAYRVPFLFKPNQTLNYSIPYLLTLREAVDLSIPERKKTLPPNADLLGFLCDRYDDLINRMGKRFAHDGGLPSVSPLLDKRLRQQTEISLAETLIALRLYHDGHGRRLPASLDELVPAYLPSIPRDYFDGGAIKYSRALRAVWSAGPEGKFQLVDADQAIHERELILPLCFDGTYAPWPRRDPDRSTLFGAPDNESGGPSESPPPKENH